MTDDLPGGWESVRLSDLCLRITKGTTPTSVGHAFTNGGVRFVKVESLDSGGILHERCAFISTEAHEALKRSQLRPDDVLFTIAGTLGRTATVRRHDVPANTNQAVAIVRPAICELAPYLAEYLAAPSVAESARAGGRGVGLQNLNLKQVGEIEVSLPPANEQRRIVDKIEALTAKSRRGKEALDAIPPLLERFRQSVLAAAFRGDLTADWRARNPDVEPAKELLARIRKERRARWEEAELEKMRTKGKEPKNDKWKAKYKEPEPVDTEGLPELPKGWCWARMHEVSAERSGDSDSIFAGPFGTIFKAKDFREEGVPIIFLRHVAPWKYRTTKPGFMDKQKWEEMFQPYSVYGGELLVTKLGDPPGACAQYPEGIGAAMVTPDVIAMRPNESLMHSRLLMHYLNSESARRFTFGASYGATRLRMNLTIFRQMPVPVPPLQEQLELERKLDAAIARAEALRERLGSENESLRKLDAGVLEAAFRGELVPQDPNDEPASALLERIRAEREKATPKKRKRRGQRRRKAAAFD